MITINKNSSELKFITFPDGQRHLNPVPLSWVNQEFEIIWRIRNIEELFKLSLLADALHHMTYKSISLKILYLMGARSDRHMQQGDSFDLKVIADIINSCDFSSVSVLDPHSWITTARINKCQVIHPTKLHAEYRLKNSVLIIPDKGAKTRQQPEFCDAIQCEKTRDSFGKVTLRVQNPEVCTGRYCVIIDDLCDGGATFLAIADQIKPSFLTLIVTHGIFSKGLQILFDKFDQIITTDSFRNFPPTSRLTVIPAEELI